jgi:drug/metabolite transporter (DMT)-like permease
VTLFSALILLIIFSGYTPIISVIDFLLLATMGVMGGCGVICLISAYRMTDPSIIAPFEYFGIPLSIYLGWAVFNEFPISKLFPGVLFIVLAGIIIIWREEKNKKVSK